LQIKALQLHYLLTTYKAIQMKNLFFLATLFLVALSSCTKDIVGSQQILTEERTVNDFEHIQVEGPVEVQVLFGESHKITVQADDNLMEHLNTTVNGNTLLVDLNLKKDVYENITLKVQIVMPNLKSVAHNAVENMKIVGFEDLTEIAITQSGIGNITMDGSSQKLLLNKNGVGKFNGFNFVTENSEVQQDGIGDVHLSVNAMLTGQLTGTGDIQFKGNPAIDLPVTGFGKIVDAN